jgi:RHS repeat-associated protein
MSIGGMNYPIAFGYNDADQQTTLTYPDGDLLTTAYGAQGWLSSVTQQLGSSSKTLLNSITFSGTNGASMLPTNATVGNSAYQWSFSYDADLRPTDSNVKLLSNNSTIYDEQLSYDAVGNVLTANTTLPTGTDHQAFCYDEQNRLIWAGATGTPPCQSLTAGTLTAAQYQQSYSYDVLDRLTNGPAGSSYTYGDSAHLDGVTSVNGYSTVYDSAGNMTCRALNGSGQSCTPSAQHGQLLTYDALGRRITWQSSSDGSQATENDVYDGEGNLVQRITTPGGTNPPTTTTTFVGGLEEITVTGSTTTTTKYYDAGPVQVIAVNGSFSYLVQDTLGSIAIEMGSSGNLRGSQLFAPYGSQRYSTGFFDTNYGFTDQYANANSGLDYYGARYYDPVIGQFTSADTVQGPNRFGYVEGNPETFIDPTGHQDCGFLGIGCWGQGLAALAGGLAWGAEAGLDIGIVTISWPVAIGIVAIAGLGLWTYREFSSYSSHSSPGIPESIGATAAPTPFYPTAPLPVPSGTASVYPLPALPGITATSPPSPLTGSAPAPTLPTTFVTPAQPAIPSEWTTLASVSQPQPAADLAKVLKADLELTNPGVNLTDTTVAVAILASGEMIVALNQGRARGIVSGFQNSVRAIGGRYIGPLSEDPSTFKHGIGTHAEDVLKEEVMNNRLPVIRLGASREICPFCQKTWISNGFPSSIFDNPAQFP